LACVLQAPLNVSVAHKIVYSPHVYGPDVAWQDYQRAPNFPANMPPIWDYFFGYLMKSNISDAAVIIGEWGGGYKNVDKINSDAISSYVQSLGMTSNIWWCLNPTSQDTGGLLMNDWVNVDPNKYNLLKSTVVNPTYFYTSGNQICYYNEIPIPTPHPQHPFPLLHLQQHPLLQRKHLLHRSLAQVERFPKQQLLGQLSVVPYLV